MVAHGIRHLPVVDEMMRVTGIVSERDVRRATGRALLEAGAERGGYVQRLRVGDVMTSDPRTLLADEPLSVAVRALVEDRFGALPVVDNQDRLDGHRQLRGPLALSRRSARRGDAAPRPAEARA